MVRIQTERWLFAVGLNDCCYMHVYLSTFVHSFDAIVVVVINLSIESRKCAVTWDLNCHVHNTFTSTALSETQNSFTASDYWEDACAWAVSTANHALKTGLQYVLSNVANDNNNYSWQKRQAPILYESENQFLCGRFMHSPCDVNPYRLFVWMQNALFWIWFVIFICVFICL